MTDVVNYKMPLGVLGQLAHWLFVRKQVEAIFDYRTTVLEKRFGRL
jgi:ligand-binding SRPBCC domain-containing protein